MRKKVIISLLFFVSVLATFYWLSKPDFPPQTNEEFQTYFWYWNSEPPNQGLIQQTNEDIDGIFLLAGELKWSQQNKTFSRISGLSSRKSDVFNGIPLHLTYHLHYENLDQFDEINLAPFADQLIEFVEKDIREYRSEGRIVEGIQLDFEVPTSQLEKYSILISKLHEQMDSDLEFSITTLHTWAETDWFGLGNFSNLVQQVDFFVPKLFGQRIPDQIPEQWNHFSSDKFIDRLTTYINYSNKVVIGLPIYGQWISYHDNQLERLDSQRAPTNDAEYSQIGFQSYKTNIQNKEAILSLPPTVELKKSIDFLKTTGFRKVSFFRFVGPKDWLTLSPVTVVDYLKAQEESCRSEVIIRSIGDNLYRAYVQFWPGLIDQRLAPKVLQVRLEDGRFIEARRGKFKDVSTVMGLGEDYTKSSIKRANALQFKRGYVQPGRPYQAGPFTFEAFSNDSKLWISFDENSNDGLKGLFDEKEFKVRELQK